MDNENLKITLSDQFESTNKLITRFNESWVRNTDERGGNRGLTSRFVLTESFWWEVAQW